MPKALPPHPNVRNCTHIKVIGQRCGSPALRREFFCYFHTRVIKGVQQRVDMQLHSMALLEDCESIQFSIMHVVDGLIKGTLDPTRARLIIQALRIAARNAKNVRFDAHDHGVMAQPIVREVPDYARQYLIEHPEFGPPLESKKEQINPTPEPQPTPDARSAGAPARVAATNAVSPNRGTSRFRSRSTSHPKERHTEKRNCRASRSRGAAKERSPRRKPWDQSRKQSSSEGAKEPRARFARARFARERDRASAGGDRRRRARQLARPPHRLRVRRNRQTQQRSPPVTREHMARQTGFEDLSSKH